MNQESSDTIYNLIRSVAAEEVDIVGPSIARRLALGATIGDFVDVPGGHPMDVTQVIELLAALAGLGTALLQLRGNVTRRLDQTELAALEQRIGDLERQYRDTLSQPKVSAAVTYIFPELKR